MSLYATLDTGRVFRWRSNEDLQAAGWIAWSPGGGWRLTRAGRRYVRRLLTLYTREDAARDLAREAAGRRPAERMPVERAAPDPKWARWRCEREPRFGGGAIARTDRERRG